jgi:urocanate hydratase
MNNMNNQPERIAVIKFYTWSKAHGNTSATAYISIVDGVLVNMGQAQHSGMTIIASVEVTKAKLKELCGIANKGY